MSHKQGVSSRLNHRRSSYRGERGRAFLRRFGAWCIYCERRPATRIEHFIPLCYGGRSHFDNLLPACEPCDAAKADRCPAEFLMECPPGTFDRIAWFFARRRKEVEETTRQWHNTHNRWGRF